MKKEREIEKIYSLTSMQEGMLFHFLEDKESAAYFDQYLFTLSGEIDRDILERSLNVVIGRHDVLRTVFVYEKIQKPKQVVLKDISLEINFIDISNLSEEEEKKYLEEYQREDRERGFNLTGEIPMRVVLLKSGTGLYKLLWSFFHITMDGWSFAIFLKELIRVYRWLKKGEGKPLEPAGPSFRQYVRWLDRQDSEEGLKYWRGYLEGYDRPAGLPKPGRSTVNKNRRYNVKKYQFKICEELSTGITQTAASHGVTVNCIFQALWGLLLQTYNNTGDVVFGTVVSGRPPEIEGIENMIGLFINTIPVRIRSNSGQWFSQLVEGVRQEEAVSGSYEYLPLAEIQADSLLRGHLFDHIFVFENYPVQEEIIKTGTQNHLGFGIERIDTWSQTSYDFNLIISPGRRFSIKFMYNGRVYDTDVIERAARHFEQIIGQVAKQPELKVRDIVIITPGERKQVLFVFNRPGAGHFRDRYIHELFAVQVEKKPDNTALHGMRVRGGQVTYRELDERSHRLACLLREKGVSHEIIVAIMLDRSIEIVIAILGILKAGGAYLPIDPEIPEERKLYILNDSGARVLLTFPDNISWFQASNIFPAGISSSSHLSCLHLSPLFSPFLAVSPGPGVSLAYVLYTSGTTGRPKGVMLDHGNVVNLVLGLDEVIYSQYTESERVALVAPFIFDASVKQVFAVLLLGHCLYIVPEEVRLDGRQLVEFYKTHQIGIADGTPGHLLLMVEGLRGARIDFRVKHFIIGGEALSRRTLNLFLSSFTGAAPVITNVYGPTECCVDAVSHRIAGAAIDSTDTNEIIPIGGPMKNQTAYIVDRGGSLLPPGIPGELCIGGRNVGRGYLNNPRLTLERFIDYKIPNQKLLRGVQGGSFLEKSPPGRRRQRIYKTGDLCRWHSEGSIEFLGRVDRQVKIRGIRIELGEIENRLLEQERIKEAVVVDRMDTGGQKFLCAYFVSAHEIDIIELKNELLKKLPVYMLPGYFRQIEEIPFTSSGKVDRNVLPSPGVQQQRYGEYVGPRDDIDGKLVKIWVEVLGKGSLSGAFSSIGIEDNFFNLGGHSLKAVQVINKIQKELGASVSLRQFFKTADIRGLSDHIKTAAPHKYISIKAVEKREYYVLSSAQKRLYFLQQMDIGNTGYNMPYVFPLGRDIDRNQIELTLNRLIARHESLRTCIVRVNEMPWQRVRDKVYIEMGYIESVTGGVVEGDFKLQYTNSRQITGSDERELAAGILKKFVRPFDLSEAPLVRSGLIRLVDGNHIWIVDMHHIISDGTSRMVLTEDFLDLYSGRELSSLRIQYKDFAYWQNYLLKSGGLEARQAYWSGIYPDSREIPRLWLPTDFKRPEVFTFSGDHYRFMLEREEAAAFKVVGARNDATLYMNILAVLNVLFFKYTGQTDIIIGSGTAGRRHDELQPVIGMFVNTLAIRCNPEADKTYDFFLKEVVAECIGAFENQDMQFEELVDKLDLERNPSRNPLFDIALVVQNFKKPGENGFAGKNDGQEEILPTAGGKIPVIDYKNPTSKVDMTFFAYERGEDIQLEIEYYTGVFARETIRRAALHFKNIIEAVTRDSTLKLTDIEIITWAEKQQLLYTFNDTTHDFPDTKPVHRLFEAQVEKTPDKIALHGCMSAGVYQWVRITYSEINRRADQLAHYLYRVKRINADERVGILMEMVIGLAPAILGILKAGGAYVPLEPSLPEERKKHIIKDSNTGIILSEKRYIRDLNRLQWECGSFHSYLCMDSHDVLREQEVEKTGLMDLELWHHVGETAVDDITAGGWVSSYTNEPFSRAEMDEFGKNILDKLTPLLYPDMKVLEIGCASGFSMYRIAPLVELYYGTDLSAVIIEKNKKRIAEQGHKNIKLACLAAHEIYQLEENNFDLIILNSVIQAFTGHNYLRQVIKKSIDLLGEKGYLFIGDIMDQEKKYSMISDLAAFKNADTKKKNAYSTKTDFSAELFIAREFFTDLGNELEEIKDIEFSNKIFTIENELTKFRYDALIHINKNQGAKKKWKRQKHQDDLSTLSPLGTESLHLHIPADNLAYVVYTSGSTGKPKGVAVGHKGIVNYVTWRLANYRYLETDVTLQPISYSFDGFGSNFYSSLLSGGKLILTPKEKALDSDFITALIRKERITNISLVPGMYELLLETLDTKDMECLRFVVLAGEKTGEYLAAKSKKKSPGTVLINEYGPTEITITATANMTMIENNTAIIGRPIRNTAVFILDNNLNLQPVNTAGELCISGPGTSRGYLNKPELTAEKFCLRRPGGRFLKKLPPWTPRKNFLLKEPGWRKVGDGGFFWGFCVYKSGDMGRWLTDGNIEFLGRVDQQVKIRGLRIELEEIECLLREIGKIKDTVVVDRVDKSGEKHLCAYVVSEQKIDWFELKNSLLKQLPEYMIPGCFVQIEKIPLTITGKVNRNALPSPEKQNPKDYAGPTDNIEKKLAGIWAQVLDMGTLPASIGIDDNFFELGGHSLKAAILTSKIYKELQVKVPLAEVFKRQNIKELAAYIKSKKKDLYSGINAIEKREYYELSSAQKRLYFLQQLDTISTSYNMPLILPLDKDINTHKLESTLKKILARHESLRTSFVKVNEIPYQKIHQELNFKIEYFDAAGKEEEEFISSILNNFIRAFDLSCAPLIRSGLIRMPDGHRIWLVDMHHIISDGTSHMILAEDFMSFYTAKELPMLRLHYKDFSQWQNQLAASGKINARENYWLNLYPSPKDIPRLDLPMDFKRPDVFTFAGDNYSFILDRRLATEFKALGAGNGATLYMNILAALNTLFYKYTGQTDIIIGSGIAGRPHADIQQIIGMFVNTLAMRNHPGGETTYETFLKDVVNNSINAFENQTVQFEELIDKLDLERNPSRNPLFDISMVVQNFRTSGREIPGDQVELLSTTGENLPAINYKNPTAKFDLTFFINEAGEDIYSRIEYYTGIFKKETIKRLAEHFKNVIKAVVRNPSTQLQDIEIISSEEKRQILYVFNDTKMDYPPGKTIPDLFSEQVQKTPDHIVLMGIRQLQQEGTTGLASSSVTFSPGTIFVTYREIDEKSNQLARYLLEANGIQPEDRVGLLLSQSLFRPIAVLGALKAGAAYIPVDPVLPNERIKYMLKDASVSIVISEKKYLNGLNRMQWECEEFQRYLCLDSFDLHNEEEGEINELMDLELWRHVGETAVDDITAGGWISSYTGEPFSRQEMDEYGDNILEKLRPLLHPQMRVLEIGCASGISMFRIAPKVGFYYGTDLSPVIIEKNNKKLAKEDLQNIKLSCLAAHEINNIYEKEKEKKFHLIIINSVIQCFHGHHYLRKVIRSSIDLLAEEGYLFLGDIMDLEKKESMIRELQDFKYSHRDKTYTTKIDFSAELFLARGFWHHLAAEFQEIQSLEISDKIHTIENELTKYRYDVLIKINRQLKNKKNEPRQKYQDDLRYLSGFGSNPPGIQLSPHHIAYLIYTSGTTGKPKGVMIEHGSLVNLCCWHNRHYQVTGSDHAALYAGFGFDASVWELFPYIITGATLYMIPDSIRLDIEMLFDYYNQHRISIGFLPTQLCERFLTIGAANSSLRILLTGGDKLHTFVNRNYTLYNNYGPTENTVVTTAYPVTGQQDNIPIGNPMANTRVYISDISGRNALRLKPVGVAGELCISGAGLARGYLNNPEFTSIKFIKPLPAKRYCVNVPGNSHMSRIYRTGDLARWLSDGNIEFLGRIDQQVKIRGYRIELGEITSLLLEVEGIREALVLDRLDESGSKYLCGYVVSKQAIDRQYLKNELLKRLPDYMIPAYFMQIDAIPLTPGGKVNRVALPSLEPGHPGEYTAPRHDMDRKLVKIWAGVLGREMLLDSIGIDNNFFELGGHSLKATILTARIHKELKVKVPLAEVFKHPTIRGLSHFISHFLHNSAENRYTPIEPVEKQEYYPLSSAQARFYILQQVVPESTAYNIAAIHQVRGYVDKDRFTDALKKLIHRHDALRTSFRLIKKQPVQRVHIEVAVDIEFSDTSIIPGFVRAFDLSRAPLLRLGLINVSTDRHILLFDMHHIITDGTSVNIFLREFMTFYAGPGFNRVLPQLSLQYKDFSQWQESMLSGEKIKGPELYWREQFAGELPVLNMPLDFPRPPVQNFEGEQFYFTLERTLTQQLNRLIKKSGITLFMFLLTVYNVLLARYTGQEDIVIGTTIAGRSHADLENIIGLFIETLALRNYPSGKLLFREFLAGVKHSTLKAYENQAYPFRELIKQFWDESDLSRNPIFDVMLIVQNFEPGEFELEGLTFFPYESVNNEPRQMSKVDLTLEAKESGEEIYFRLEYCTRLFKRDTTERLKCHFINILREVVTNPEIPISGIKMISEEEKRRILEEFNHIDIDYNPVQMVHELFSRQVEETPDFIAAVVEESLVDGMSGRGSITYRELNLRADRLAHNLKLRGSRPDVIVGIMVEPSFEMIIGILGILKSGGAYMPIDPDYPLDRIRYMLSDSSGKLLIGNENRIDGWNGEILHVGEVCNSLPGREPGEIGLPSGVGFFNLSYVVYTSGSTGRPKGVLVEHGNLVSYIDAFEREFELRSDDTVIQQASYVFDVFVEELYPILLKGGKLVIPGREAIKDMRALSNFIIRHRVTMITCSPQLLNELNNIPGLLPSLRIIISGGDRLKAADIGNFLKKAEVYNTYGPTEATVCATYYRCTPGVELPANISIGKPIVNYRIYILSKYDKIQPVGIPGELNIQGNAVTRGYINRPELTNQQLLRKKAGPGGETTRFLEKSPPGRRRQKIYKTGDLGRWSIDGNIEFLGRIDRQVKVRGYRVELGEIENRLTGLNRIKQALVVPGERASGQKYLAAYIVCESSIEMAEVKTLLLRQLPGYMVPAYIVPVEEIPVTTSGKLDRKRLPVPGAVLGRSYSEPGSNKEKLLAKIWKEVLERDRIGPDDNFFDLGGTSLDIFRVSTRIREIFNKQIPTVMMFKHSTIRLLAGYLEETGERDGISGKSEKEKKSEVQIEKSERINSNDIAVIGMAGRFPGARNIHEFWENLKNGIETISFFSDDELLADGIEPGILKNSHYIKARGITAGVEYFDSSFFGYASTEAQFMDPQVRIFLQCAWHGLEDAGYNPFSYEKRIGLYAGASPNLSWEGLASLTGTKQGFSGFMVAQLADKDFMCTHISYKLNLQGPAVSLQTACSTSLASIHWAVRGLLSGECEMALAGGVSIAFPTKQGYMHQEGMIFSPDGHNRTFDLDAAGSVFGDGVGVVVLKHLDYALEDRDHIYGVIKGSAINNDGYRKVGYTAPSIDGQAEVVKSAQLAAGIEPETITYVEAHGTATPIGDNIEIEALKQAFNTCSAKKSYCAVGTVKSNIGHLYSASGTAGFIKTILALKHRLIPPSLHVKTPNLDLDFENSPFYVNTKLKKWKSNGFPLRAGVSSFGIGGTNVHVILEEIPVLPPAVRGALFEKTAPLNPPQKLLVFLLSAASPGALENLTMNLGTYVQDNPGINLTDTAYTLQVGRKHFAYRKMAVCAAPGEGMEIDKVRLDFKRVPGVLVKEENCPVIFMFCGQGSQYVNMGIDLYRSIPLFRDKIDRCFEILKSLLGYDLKEILYPRAASNQEKLPHINQAIITQPVVFTFEYALATLLMEWGIKPRAMIGYSFGEYIAACISGVFSLEQTLKLITIRAQLIEQTPTGAMTSVPLPEKELKPLLNENLWLAIVNGPTCIVSGSGTHVQAFEKEMKKKRIICVPLNISRALHSGLMAPIRSQFEKKIREFQPAEPRIPYISNVTARWIKNEETTNPGYWGDHLCSTVRFSEGLKELLKEENAIFMEIGPGRILGMMVRTHPDKKPGQKILNTVKHQQEKTADHCFLLEKIGQLWLYGQNIDWTKLNPEEKKYRVSLPGYPFEEKRYWFDLQKDAFTPGNAGTLLVSPTWETTSGHESSHVLENLESNEPPGENIETPGSELEKAIVHLWQEFLGVKTINFNDNFFQLNGNSLIAFQLIGKLNDKYQVEIPMNRFYENPTIAHLASVIKELLTKQKKGD